VLAYGSDMGTNLVQINLLLTTIRFAVAYPTAGSRRGVVHLGQSLLAGYKPSQAPSQPRHASNLVVFRG
jgi:hypothetical protein